MWRVHLWVIKHNWTCILKKLSTSVLISWHLQIPPAILPPILPQTLLLSSPFLWQKIYWIKTDTQDLINNLNWFEAKSRICDLCWQNKKKIMTLQVIYFRAIYYANNLNVQSPFFLIIWPSWFLKKYRDTHLSRSIKQLFLRLLPLNNKDEL